MIVWINGAFGVGKTSVAEALCRRLPEAHFYDPEEVGYFLWHSFPEPMRRQGNFQHIPLWREFNWKLLLHMDSRYAGTIVAPMTVYRRAYYDEMLGRLRREGADVRHFILTAGRETILRRLVGRGETADGWAAQHLDVCLQAFAGEIPGTPIDTEGKTAEAAAAEILEQLDIR